MNAATRAFASEDGVVAGLTVAEAVRRARRALTDAGVATADLDARILVGHAAGLDRTGMITESRRELDAHESSAVADLVDRRATGEPVGRILGRREFWGLDFKLGAETLEPRPDSETIVEAALEIVDARFSRDLPLRLADLGTGSGCLLISLLYELPAATGLGVDISAGALGVARSNAIANGVGDRAGFVAGSWTTAFRAPDSPNGDREKTSRNAGFDLIVANPPYIESNVCLQLDREVADHDPILALDGGPDGLDAYRGVLGDIGRVLAPSGVLIFELGQNQRAKVSELALACGLETGKCYRDLAGIERALCIAKP